MTAQPFVLGITCLRGAIDESFDQATNEDPLPAIIEKDTTGFALVGSTRLTEVNHETTDDQ